MNSVRIFLFSVFSVCVASVALAQNTASPAPGEVRDTTYKSDSMQYLSLKECIDYAMIHQPGINKAQLNIEITRANNAVTLAPWLPQVNASGNLQHYLKQSSVNSGTVTTTDPTTGTTTSSSSGSRTSYANSFIPELSVSQAIFSPALLYASKAAPLYVKAAQQVTDSTKIFLVSSVTKSFYSLLLTLEEINVLKEDTTRLGKNVVDAYHQYKGGIVDETDYEEASITLNNSKASLRQAQENIVPQYAALKQLIGFPVEKQFNVKFDTVQMFQAINIDSLQQLKYERRIEFQQLNTQKQLQDQSIAYYKTSFLPTLSAFFNYNLAYESQKFSDLFQNNYPSSVIGLSLNVPIFTGFARTNNLKKARLERQLLDWDQVDLKLQINKEYTSALASYRGNRYNLALLQKNVTMAQRTYFVVTLQYKQGIIPYLNVITAESNLVTSKINYINALFQVLQNKVDLDKAMGNITY